MMTSSSPSRPDPTIQLRLPVLVLFLFGLGKCLCNLSPMVSTFDVVEEVPIRTVISGVAEYLNQLALLGAELPNSTTFHIMGSDAIARSLTLNPKTGVLTVSARIDREALCGGSRLPDGSHSVGQSASPSSLQQRDFSFSLKPCIKPLNILIKSQVSGLSGDASSGAMRSDATTNRKQILLRILDINDNPPRWPGHNKLTVSFVETFQSTEFDRLRGFKLDANDFGPNSDQFKLLERAVDLDAGLNGTISYTLKGAGSEFFRLEDVDLPLHGGGSSATAGSTGSVDFSMRSNYDNQVRGGYGAQQPLRIWPNILLDRETTAVYNLTLVAYDSGNPQLSGKIALEIHITDVNDNAPVFHSPAYESSPIQQNSLEDKSRDRFMVRYTPPGGHLLETAAVGSPVLQLNATDADVGDNAKITYLIAPSDKNFAQQYFNLDQVTGLLKVKAPLDYDLGPRQFTFTVIALDGAPEPYRLTSTALVHIEVTDVNDEPPKLEILIAQNGQDLLFSDSRGWQSHINPMTTSQQQQELVAYIEETPSPDTVIAYVQVSDKDENGEDDVRCFLGPRDNFTLQAEPMNQGQMDGRFKGNFEFGVVSGLRENGRKVTEYRILAKVPSGPQSGRAGADLQGLLDRETTPSQVITITCTDSAGNQAERKIRLHLLDINDNPPRFLNDGHFSFSVVENVQPTGGQNIWLGRVVAVDPDLGDNAKISYRLATELTNEKHPPTSDVHNLFFIKEDTGDMYAQMSLDRENAPENGIYTMTVLAVDHGRSNSLTGTAKVDVVILDVNDWAPEFTRDIYTFTVPEDAPLREVIGVVEAIDRDATAQPGSITYHMNTVKITRPYEANSQVSKRSPSALATIASSSPPARTNSTQRSATANLTSNDTTTAAQEMLQRQPRQLSQQSNKRGQQVRSGSPYTLQSGQPIFMPHLEPSKLAAQLPLSYFAVDSRTGEIRIIRKLDRESNAYFTFEVIATDSPPADSAGAKTDSGANSAAETSTAVDSALQRSAAFAMAGASGSETFTATATVAVTIIDVNDNAPEFRYPNSSILLHMAPDETLGHKILTVQAVDRDEGENARISYSIRSEIPIPPDGPGTGCFAIDEASGLIFLTRPIRGPVNHRLVIEACDHGAIPRCTSSPGIRITVSDAVKLGASPTRPRPHARIPGQPESLSEVDRFGYEAYFPGGLDPGLGPQQADGQVTHRIEVIAACLVVVFGVLLFAAVVLVCLLKRRPQGGQNQRQEEALSCKIWSRRWSLFQRKTEKNATSGTACNDQGLMGDTRLTDNQALRSPTAKGTINSEPFTNTLDVHSDGEKKPLYYDGIDTLPDTLMPAGIQHLPRRADNRNNRLMMIPSAQCLPLSRPMRPVGNVPPGYTAGGTFVLSGRQQSIVFNGLSSTSGGGSCGGGQQVTTSGGRIYGTLPVVSSILSGSGGPGGEMATCQMRPAFHPAVSHAAVSRATNTLEIQNPPSPDYQSLDALANDNERLRNHLSRNQFIPSSVKPLMELPIQGDYTSTNQQTPTFAKQSASYGCLIDSVESSSSQRMPAYPLQNYYEITALNNNNMGTHARQFPAGRSPYHSNVGGGGGASRRYQRSATLGRLGTMAEAEPVGRFTDGECGDLHHPTAGDLTFISTNRPYSRLQATQSPPDGMAFGHDKPTKYTYQAIREASFV